MTSPQTRIRSKVERELLRRGVLLESDAVLPSVVGLVAGGPVRGSWWGHPKGHDIFAACQHLVDHEDVVLTKLVAGKITFVHRELWAPLLAIATSGEAWQTDGLTGGARELLAEVEAADGLRTDEYKREHGLESKPFAKDVLELERRLLVHVRFLHTEGGHHSKVLRTWKAWSADQRTKGGLGGRTSARTAREIFEHVLSEQNEEFGGNARLPWQT